MHLCFLLYEKRVNYSPPNNPLHPHSHRNHHSYLHRDPLGRHNHDLLVDVLLVFLWVALVAELLAVVVFGRDVVAVVNTGV